jgi:hypothetical protein
MERSFDEDVSLVYDRGSRSAKDASISKPQECSSTIIKIINVQEPESRTFEEGTEDH